MTIHFKGGHLPYDEDDNRVYALVTGYIGYFRYDGTDNTKPDKGIKGYIVVFRQEDSESNAIRIFTGHASEITTCLMVDDIWGYIPYPSIYGPVEEINIGRSKPENLL